MITATDGHVVPPVGTRVRVHWNIQKGGYSLSVPSDIRVVGRMESCCLKEVTFVVSEKQLARMRGLGKRKVVAWAEGTLCECGKEHGTTEVTFNPWKGDRFTDRTTGAVVESAAHVHMTTVAAPGRKPAQAPRTIAQP